MSLNLFRYTIEYDKKSQQQDIDLCSFYVSRLTKDKIWIYFSANEQTSLQYKPTTKVHIQAFSDVILLSYHRLLRSGYLA